MKKVIKTIIALSLIMLFMCNTSFVTVTYAANALTLMQYSFKTIPSYLATLDDLMAQCKEKGIPTDYEKVTYTVLERWKQYITEDKDNGFLSIFDSYTKVVLDEMYNEAKTNLEAYLAGTKKAMSVPRYVTSDIEIDDFTVTAETVNSEGVRERRPVYFIGYGHFDDARNDIPNFQDFGANTIQQEIGPNEVITTGNRWSVGINLAEATFDFSNEEGPDGFCAKFTNKTPMSPGVCLTAGQAIRLKPSTNYTLSLKVKAENINNVQVSWDGGSHRFNIPDGTYDWTEVSFDFYSDITESGNMWICIQDITDACYIDDIRITEKGGTENVVVNGNFDEIIASKDGKYFISRISAKHIADMLADAEESDISVCLLVSPHYFPTFMFNIYPDMKYNNGSYDAYIPHHEKTLEMLGEYLRALVSQVKDYKSLGSICLTNEPHFVPAEFGDFYKPMWIEFLKDKYNGSLAELNAAHSAAYTDWSEVPLKGSFEYSSVLNYDCQLFGRELFADWHKYLANIVHEIDPDIPVHAKAQGYIGGIERWANNVFKNTDFEYFNEFSDIAGCDFSIEYLGVKNGTHKPLYGSLWYDYMAGIGGKPVDNSEDHISVDGEENFVPQQALWMQTNMWQGAIHHRGFSQVWVWRKSYDPASIYYGSILFRPDCIKAIGQTNLDLNRLSYEVDALVSSEEDVAVLYSPTSRQFVPEHIDSLYNAYESTLFNGKKVKVVTEKNISKINGCKVLIIPSCKNVPADTISEIYTFMQNGGKIIIIDNNSLSKNEYNNSHDSATAALVSAIKSNAKNISCSANGYLISSPSRSTLASTFESYFKEWNVQEVWLADANTGARVTDTEWTETTYDGDRIINICNYTFDTPKTVKLVVNGKAVKSSVNMMTGETQGESFVINPCDPVMVKIDGGEKPAEVENVTASNNGTTTTFTWNANDAKIAGARIYTKDGELLAESKTTSCSIANSVLTGTVVVKAINASGKESYGVPVALSSEKVFSVELNATKSGTAVKYDVTVSNDGNTAAAGKVIIRLKDSNGKVIDALMNTKLINAGEDVTFSGLLGNTGAVVEAVVVSGTSSGTELSQICTINLE